MCLYNKLIINPKYKPNKKNGGVAPPLNDIRVKYVPIGCGKCMECKKKKMNEWRVRLIEECREKNNGKFITLTFSNDEYTKLKDEVIVRHLGNRVVEGYDMDNEIATLAVRRFTERWRKEHGRTVRHWLVTELGHGATEHLHMHGIIWDGSEENIRETGEKIERIWKYGWVWKGKEYKGRLQNYVNERTINYMAKYMLKVDEKHKEYKQIILTSNGIGRGYTDSSRSKDNKYKGEETREEYRKDNGSKSGLPIYYRNKIYSEKEREELWINKIEKQERWVGKTRIDISTKEGEERYIRLREEAKKINRKMGYGGSWEDIERKEYEKALRIIKQESRGKRIEVMKEIEEEFEKIKKKVECNIPPGAPTGGG